VIIRRIERRKIFQSDDDHKNFITRLSKLISESKIDYYAWVLLSNHGHFLLKTGSAPLSVFMSRLLTGYAGWLNKKHRRHGQLFQNRYQSILCQQYIYLKELVCYIH
jgi:putative transposase